MKVIFSLFFIFLYCKQSAANDLWTIDKNISSIEFEVPVLFANNVIGKFNEFDGFVSLDLSNQNNNKALINVRIDSLDINYKRYKDLVISEAKEILDVEDVIASIMLVEDLRIQRD